jgi:hypothetical protein
MLSYSISYWDLTKFPYFADTTERGDKGDFIDNSTLYKTYHFFIMFFKIDSAFIPHSSNTLLIVHQTYIVIVGSINYLWVHSK